MTAQNSANKSVFYKFLPYYLNKVKYLRPQLIMSIIFSVLSYPAFMLIINILCPVERELIELSQYISDPTPEQYEMNMALLDKRSLLYSLLIAEIVIGFIPNCFATSRTAGSRSSGSSSPEEISRDMPLYSCS